MKKILHISRMNFLSNKAHVYTTTKTCEALAMQEGLEVVLLSTDDSLRNDVFKNDFFVKHSIKKRFGIVSLRSLSNKFKKNPWRVVNWLETILVNFSISRYIISNHSSFDILYYRDCSLFLPILISKYLYKKPIFLELHAVLHKRHGQWLNNFFAKISDGLIAITYGLKKYYETINSKIIVSFCAAAEPDKFEIITETKEQLRVKLGLPLDKIILMYSGNLYKTGNYDSYGIEDIINALPYMDKRVVFYGIGKKGTETKSHEELIAKLGIESRVTFLPWMDRAALYQYWKASDILIHPAAGAKIGNSPTKIFEYLAAGKPIISAKTEPIEEVLKDRYNALLVDDYNNPNQWVKAVKTIICDESLTSILLENALSDSKKFTWLGRGQAISKFIFDNI